MFTFILFVLSLVALSTAQLNVGPQTFPEPQSSFSYQLPYKRFVNNQGFKYIIAPIQFNNAQNIRSENQQLNQQNYESQALLPFINFAPNEELQGQNREQVQVQSQAFNQNEKPTYQNSQVLRFLNSYAEQKPKQQYQLVKIQQGNQFQKELSPTQYSNKEQVESYLLEQLRRQLSRTVDNKQINLKALSTVSEENQFTKAAELEQPSRSQSNYQEEKGEAALRKEIENILRGQGNFESAKQNIDEAGEPNYQKSPFFVHRLVTVTKHHPVNIVKQVKVAVPTPVLVPVPEPYEVKVPHPYHVPVEVIRHIPIPIVRAH